MNSEEEPAASRPSRYSDDRSWWWDGEQWQPIEGSSESLAGAGRPSAEKAPPPPPPPRPERRWGPLIGIGGLMLVLAMIALATALGPVLTAHRGSAPSHSATPAPRHSPTPTHRPSARPSAPATPSAPDAQRYVQVVVTGSQRMTPQIDAVEQSCSGGADLSRCRAALVGLQGATRDFRQALAGEVAPSCLRSVDGQLRGGLDLFDQGTSASIAAIDGHDAQGLVNGMGQIQSANDHLGQASALAQSAKC